MGNHFLNFHRIKGVDFQEGIRTRVRSAVNTFVLLARAELELEMLSMPPTGTAKKQNNFDDIEFEIL